MYHTIKSYDLSYDVYSELKIPPARTRRKPENKCSKFSPAMPKPQTRTTNQCFKILNKTLECPKAPLNSPNIELALINSFRQHHSGLVQQVPIIYIYKRRTSTFGGFLVFFYQVGSLCFLQHRLFLGASNSAKLGSHYIL